MEYFDTPAFAHARYRESIEDSLTKAPWQEPKRAPARRGSQAPESN